MSHLSQPKPASDLHDGDKMWDPTGCYLVTNVRRDAGVVTFDVHDASDGYTATGWELPERELVRLYV